MSPSRSDSLDLALRTARRGWAALIEVAAPDVRKSLGLTTVRVGEGQLQRAAALDHFMFNRALGLAPHDIPEAVSAFRSANVSRFMLSFDADEIAAALEVGEPLGLQRFHRPWATLMRRFDDVSEPPSAQHPPQPAGVILRIAEPVDAPRLGELCCEGFDVPPAGAAVFAGIVGKPGWDVLVAEDDESVVGVGILFSEGRGAYLLGGVTAPSHRRRGIQGALVARRLALARARGAAVVASETGVAVRGKPNSSWNNLVRAGLRPVHTYEHLCPSGTGWSPSFPSSARTTD